MNTRSIAKWTVLPLSLLALMSAPLMSISFFLSLNSSRANSPADARTSDGPENPPAAKFNASGQLVRPTGYRKWIYVGTPLTPNDMNNGRAAFPEFHSVYIAPDAYRHYEKTGAFPDHTVLVKELVSVGGKQATSGNGYFMGEFTGLEVLIKDKQRFKDQPGNWGFFSFGHEYPLKPVADIQPVANCNTCHQGAADDDFVFTQYYPVLREAKTPAK